LAVTLDRRDPRILHREELRDKEATARLPEQLGKLLQSPVFGLTAERELPPAAYGVYLLSEKGRPQYVGRVGLTDRSRRAGKGHSNFRTRLKGHATPRHEQGTYAYGCALKVAQSKDLPLGTRKANCEIEEFMAEVRRECERVRCMDCQVVEMGKDENRLAAGFEIYAAHVLGLDEQTFAVS
jgi:hypothetical protein